MIIPDTIAFWENLDPERRFQLALARLEGKDTVPFDDPRLPEAPEDVLIVLLTQKDVSVSTREDILRACRHVLSHAFAHLAEVATSPPLDERTLVRVCRVIDIAEAAELRRLVLPLFDAAIRSRVGRAVLSALARACVANTDSSDVRIWDLAFELNDIAPYAINALMSIDPNARELDEKFIQLARRSVAGEVNVDLPMLLRRLERMRGGEGSIRNLLSRLGQDDVLAESLRAAFARYVWSEHWLDNIEQRSSNIRRAPTRILIPKARKPTPSPYLAVLEEYDLAGIVLTHSLKGSPTRAIFTERIEQIADYLTTASGIDFYHKSSEPTARNKVLL